MPQKKVGKEEGAVCLAGAGQETIQIGMARCDDDGSRIEVGRGILEVQRKRETEAGAFLPPNVLSYVILL